MKPFNLKAIIKQRVDLEADVEYSNDPIPPLSPFEKPKKVPLCPAVYNFIKFNVLQLLP